MLRAEGKLTDGKNTTGAFLAACCDYRVWALFAIHLGNVLDLFKILGIVASPILAIAAVQILRINTRFLPPEIRPPWWRRIALAGSVLVYGGISVALAVDLLAKR